MDLLEVQQPPPLPSAPPPALPLACVSSKRAEDPVTPPLGLMGEISGRGMDRPMQFLEIAPKHLLIVRGRDKPYSS